MAKDATPRKRSRECDLLKDDADWLSTTPDPLSKKQRAEDSQSFSPGEPRDTRFERDPFRKQLNQQWLQRPPPPPPPKSVKEKPAVKPAVKKRAKDPDKYSRNEELAGFTDYHDVAKLNLPDGNQYHDGAITKRENAMDALKANEYFAHL